MTEKRFNVVYDDIVDVGHIHDNEDEKFLKVGALNRTENICDLLNELNDENTGLHIQNDFLKDENQQMKSNGLNVLHFYENKLKNSKRKDFQSVRDEIWIVKQVLYEMGVLDD